MVQSVKYELKFILLRTLSEDWNTDLLLALVIILQFRFGHMSNKQTAITARLLQSMS